MLIFVFFFLLKWRYFDLKKIDLGDPVTRSKPETLVLNQTGSKNYDHHTFKYPRNMVLMNKQ
jgi:hypothetical protein